MSLDGIGEVGDRSVVEQTTGVCGAGFAGGFSCMDGCNISILLL